MSDRGAATAQFPIRYADILFAEVLDPNGQNPKIRRVVVVTPNLEWRPDTHRGCGVTTTLPDPLTSDYVRLPYKNPPARHPRTGMTKVAAVLCTWIVPISPSDIHGRSGFVPPAYMTIVDSKTAVMAKAIGGWP